MQVKMPQLGETVVEGTILKWLKQEGDDVAQDEPLFEISTDKVDTEVPSPAAGKLTKILVPEGETVSVGTDLATIDSGDGAAGGDAGAAAPAADSRPASEEPASAPAEASTDGGSYAASAATPAPAEAATATAAPSQAPATPAPHLRRPPRWRLPRRLLRLLGSGGRVPGSSRRWCADWPTRTRWTWLRSPGPGRGGGSRRRTC
jgi:pyruvate/2-oxoglutarate dehydrogenase complex dihydrolipoamide acyltransferase (E2) component